ncbi:DUF1176 domain-containing protein [Geminocystis sp.]|uniref:DUF1176 domain-containing protein n=1 Tax=Geminocystis sp. TaxID=2664100 RepID=UPI003594901D
MKKSDNVVKIEPKNKQEIINKVYTQQKSLNLCNQQQDKGLSKDSANIYSLNNQQYLIEIICFLGAYQSNYQYLFFDQNLGKIEVINFDTFDNSTDNLKLIKTNTLNGMTDFELTNQTLILITKSRGMGDCGSFARYKWTNNQFELKEYRYKKDCDEVYISPENYPLIYP